MPLGAFLRAGVWMFMGTSVVVAGREWRGANCEWFDDFFAARYSPLATRSFLFPVRVSRPPFAPRHARGLRLQRLRGRLVLLEIELDLGAVDVEEEHLP